MLELDERPTQTKIKHEILEEYLTIWGSIITKGLKRFIPNPKPHSRFKTRFVYIDYFAFSGAYCENGQTVYGSPIIGVKELDRIKRFFADQTGGLVPTTTTILFEENESRYKGLLTTLQEQGYGSRIKQLKHLSMLSDGDIAVINDDSSLYIEAILKFINLEHTYSFHFIDPYGSKGVTRENLEKIVSQRRADCIINMMLNHVSRWISVATKAEINPTEQAHARFLDAYYGSDIWRKIGQNIASGAITRQQAEYQLVNAFDAILREADPELAVKQIPLQFQDKDQILYYLFLTTHDPTGAFTLNELLADARVREYDYRTEKRQIKKCPGQLELEFFNTLPDQNRPAEAQADIDILADQISSACKKQTMNFRAVLHQMANSPYFLGEVKQALGQLQKQKRASFEGTYSKIKVDTQITFL